MPKISKNLVSQDVSKLTTLPGPYTKPEPNTSYSVGDTHGNAVVLIRYLYEAGIINIDQEEYDQLIKIYALDSDSKFTKLTKKDCDRFREILKKGFSAASVPEGIHVRCFGDMLADRGSNDILNLIVLSELRESFPDIRGTILISNHDKSLLSNYLKGLLQPGQKLSLEVNPCNSLIRLKQLIDNKIISYAEVEKMIKTAYLPALKLVDYVRREDGGIDIMAHAPITLNAIHQTMQTFLPSDKHLNIYESVDNMAQVLDELNAVFQNGLTDQRSLMYKAITSAPSAMNPINQFVWTRLAELKLTDAPEQPKYSVRFRHGHDGEPGETIIHGISYIGYNSILGKASPQHWGQAESARLTMSYIQSSTSEEQSQALNEVITAQMEPTIIVEQDSTVEVPIEHEIPESTGVSITVTVADQKDLFNFQCQATLRINNYISTRGSYSNTDTGDKLWTAIADSRNLLRSTFGLFSIDVPQVNLAKQLKKDINQMTVNNFNEIWSGLKEQLDQTAVNLPNSGAYVSLLKTIVADFNDSTLQASLSSSNTNI